MAGRKSSSEPNLISTLLSKLGFGGAQPAPEAKKGKRRRKRRTEGEPAPGEGAYGGDEGEASPFAGYGQAGGLMTEGHERGPLDHGGEASYEAAAAAGYAPPPPAGESGPSLPLFGTGDPPGRSTEPAPAAQGGKLFATDALDNSLDALFSGLETGMASPPIPPTDATPAPAARTEEEQPLFGELVAEQMTAPTPAAAPEAAPAAELPTAKIHKPIVTSAGPPVEAGGNTPAPAPGAPAAPLPQPPHGVEGFRLAAPTVLALAQGVDLRSLLAAIDRVPGIAGSLIVGEDGLIIASTLPPEIDQDYLGAQACNLFTGNKGQLEKMKRGELRRILLETASGAMLVTAADMGILVVVSQEGRAMDVAGVMGAIGGALGQG